MRQPHRGERRVLHRRRERMRDRIADQVDVSHYLLPTLTRFASCSSSVRAKRCWPLASPFATPSIAARPGLAIGVGGRPATLYVLYGESIFRSSRSSSRHVPSAYWIVGSASSFMPTFRRFAYTPAICALSLRSRASRSTTDASFTRS